jgi:O-antigen/teichoic acid export membrane protein
MAAASFAPINEAFIADDQARVRDLFNRSGVNIAIASVALLALITPNLATLVKLLPTGYEAVAPLSVILMLGRLTDALTGMNSEVIGISRHYKFLFRISALLLIVLILSNRLLIPRFGVYGAAWSAALSLAAFNIGKMVFLWLRFRLHPFSRGTAQVLLAGIISGLLGWLLPDFGLPIVAMSLRGAFIAVVYLALLLWWKPSADLHTYVASIRKNKRLF